MEDFGNFVEKKAEGTEFGEDEIQRKVEDAKEQAETKFGDKNEKFKSEKVRLAVSSWLDSAAQLTKKTIDVLRVTNERDTVAIQRQQAIDAFEKNPQKAIDDGLVNRNGEPIWRGGPNVGDPMPEHIWKKFIYGLDQKGNLVSLSTRKDLYDVIDGVEEKTRVKMGLNEGNFGPGDRLHQWNVSRYSAPHKTEDLEEDGITERLRESRAYENLEEVREMIENAPYTPVILDCFADRVADETPEGQNQRVLFTDAERSDQITVWVDEEEEIPFNEGSKVWIAGSLKFGNRYRDDMDQDPLQTARLYCLLPDPQGQLLEEEEDIIL